jgi:hypothetical protein
LVLIRFHLKFALVITTLCTLTLAAIRAQPYDDSELRAFLLPPEGCAAPCFMGIRPGVTTGDEAIAILERTGWIAQMDVGNPTINGAIDDLY